MGRKILIVIFWLAVWHGLALWVDNPILLVTPTQALWRLWELLPRADFWCSVGASLLRISGGFFLGTALGLFLAGASYKSRLLEEVLSPVMTLLKAIPVASFAVILLIWWGSSALAAAISFLVVFPNLYVQTLEGLRAADQKLLEMGRVFGLPFWNRFFYIYRPALKPFVYGAMKISLGMSWKSGVAAEVIGIPDFSIGERLYLSKINLDTAGVFAWTAVVILLSVVFERAVLFLLSLFFRWEPSCRRSALKKESGTEGRLLLSGVSKSYGELSVIKNLSASYGPGEQVLLQSPSGSGKTTLLRLLCGLEQPDEGSILRQGNCSMVFQEDRLCEDYSAVKNVELVTGDRECAKRALRELLEEEALYKPCRELSGGMKRRVALVRALEADSRILLLDEPFTGMDVQTRERAREYVEKRRKGRLLVMATHMY